MPSGYWNGRSGASLPPQSTARPTSIGRSAPTPPRPLTANEDNRPRGCPGRNKRERKPLPSAAYAAGSTVVNTVTDPCGRGPYAFHRAGAPLLVSADQTCEGTGSFPCTWAGAHRFPLPDQSIPASAIAPRRAGGDGVRGQPNGTVVETSSWRAATASSCEELAAFAAGMYARRAVGRRAVSSEVERYCNVNGACVCNRSRPQHGASVSGDRRW
jgi:hypothetical protein